jgi:tRNA pseudouridine55 synthase
MEGFLLVDKPKGMTSHDVVKEVRKLLPRGVKVGHTGTLDPIATGLLILAVGRATRLAEYITKKDKCYEAHALLGFTSDTYDTEGSLKRVDCPSLPSRTDVEKALSSFVGEVEQTPPPFSAVRIGGRRAYELARRGESFSLPKRRVKIYSAQLLSYSFPDLAFNLCCSSGTYVRSVVNDLGNLLGCGAVLKELRRVKVGSFSVDEAVSLATLKEEGVEKFLKPAHELLELPVLKLPLHLEKRFINGAKINLFKLPDALYKVFSSSGKFLGVGKMERGVLKAEKVIRRE